MRGLIVSKSEQRMLIIHIMEVPGGSVVKNLPANAKVAEDVNLVSGLERFPGEGKGNSLQDSCLENSMDRAVWQVIVHGITDLGMTDQLIAHTYTHTHTHTHKCKRN